eukprot:10955760-Heterocapsa_arctica.AAC.1
MARPPLTMNQSSVFPVSHVGAIGSKYAAELFMPLMTHVPGVMFKSPPMIQGTLPNCVINLPNLSLIDRLPLS